MFLHFRILRTFNRESHVSYILSSSVVCILYKRHFKSLFSVRYGGYITLGSIDFILGYFITPRNAY